MDGRGDRWYFVLRMRTSNAKTWKYNHTIETSSKLCRPLQMRKHRNIEYVLTNKIEHCLPWLRRICRVIHSLPRPKNKPNGTIVCFEDSCAAYSAREIWHRSAQKSFPCDLIFSWNVWQLTRAHTYRYILNFAVALWCCLVKHCKFLVLFSVLFNGNP